jgi:transposase-like protein
METLAKRRTFSAEYKDEILRRAIEVKSEGRGRLRGFLSSIGLTTSHLTQWRKKMAREGGTASRGRPVKNYADLERENRCLRRLLAAAKRRAGESDRLVLLQLKYVKAAALRLERKDRGLLSELISQVERATKVSSICDALALSRRDYYRTIRPILRSGGGP